MPLPSAALALTRSALLTMALWASRADFAALAAGKHGAFMHVIISLGLVGVFLVAVVDSSFVPLPVPGLTDIMLIIYAAQHQDPYLLVAVASIASALGGWLSYRVGQSGGMDFIERRTPRRVFERVSSWMEAHSILAVALPALLPPPMPLSPFVLAAGALKMSLRKFMIAFSISRLVRHTIAVLLGIFYGKAVLGLWHKFSDQWATRILIFIWVGIAISLAYAGWQIWKTTHSIGSQAKQPA